MQGISIVLAQFASSNAVQLAGTAAAGLLAYMAAARWPALLALLGYAAAALLAVSFVLDVGEVYSYSDFYKRAFSVLGDDVTTWLTPLMLWAVLSRRRMLAFAVACAILFSGTKISLLLLVLQFAVLALIHKQEPRALALRFATPLLLAAAVYVPLVLASPHAISAANRLADMSSGAAAAGAGAASAGASASAPVSAPVSVPAFAPTRLGKGSCREGNCLIKLLARPLRQRSVSAVAGLWMTLQGGFAGPRYPGTADKFADLMVAANPWGVNDAWGVTRDEWQQIGTVQTPYLQFGSGYGMAALAGLLLGVAGIAVLGARNIANGERDPFVAFTVFFIVNAVVNQTQPWLIRGPILMLMGFSAAHIVARHLAHRAAAPAGA